MIFYNYSDNTLNFFNFSLEDKNLSNKVLNEGAFVETMITNDVKIRIQIMDKNRI